MKKIISLCLLLAVMLSMVICVQAAGPEVLYTAGSSFEVGGTATVDITKTAQSLLNYDGVTSDLYDAALEKNMSVMWRCSNGPDKYGNSVTWTADDAGKEYMCRVSFYSDKACTQFVDYIDGDPFEVSSGQQVDAEITTKGPLYFTKGVAASYQLKCNVSGVTFEPFRTSLPKGMDITANGLINGTPTTAGFTFVTIAVYKDGEMIGSEGFEIYVQEPNEAPEPEITTTSLPEATVGKDYYVKIKCADPDASFGEWYDPGKANDLSKTGLILTQHGELEGKPTKAGSYTFTICAVGEAGERYMTYTLVVNEEKEETTTPTTEGADPDEKPTKKPVKKADKNDSNKNASDDEEEEDLQIWMYVGAGLGAAILIMGVVIIVLLVKKRKNQ